MLKVLDKVCIPTKGTKGSSCIDLYASKDIAIYVGEIKIVPLGVKIDLETLKKDNYIHWKDYGDFESFMESHCLELKIRSSGCTKKGLVIANGVGEIDLDYPDEIGIILHNPITEHNITWWIDRIAKRLGLDTDFNNDNTANRLIKKGDKIAQLKFVEHKSYIFGINSDDIRDGGFGSTDKEKK